MGIELTEQALIGGLIARPSWIQSVADILKPEDFLDEKARKACLAIMSLWKDSKPVDATSITAAVDNVLYISAALDNAILADPVYYSRLIIEAAKKRRVEGDLRRIAGIRSVDDQLTELHLVYQREMATGNRDAKIHAVLERFSAHIAENRKRKTMGWPTGFSTLEEAYIQYVPSHIWTIGGFTSTGKTAMAVQKLCNLLVLDPAPRVVLISTEMSEEQVVARILSNFSGVHVFRILSGNYRHGEEDKVEEYRQMIKGKPLEIHDSVYDVADIETVFHRARLQGGVDIGIVDYVQNCRMKGAGNEYQEQSNIAKRLQKLAKDCRCTLLCLSQVSNDVGRGNTDQLELKGAGEWAAVSDVGVMLQRHKELKHKLKYDVKKNRHGKLVSFFCEYKQDFTSVEETIER